MKSHSLTVLITALNEERTISSAIYETETALKKYSKDYEMIAINDGSTDNTGKILNALSKKNSKLKVVHNKQNKNLGFNMRLGVRVAKKEYCMAFVNADGPPTPMSFKKLFSAIGKKQLVLGYSPEFGKRHVFRRFLSWAFVKVMNLLFGFNIRYYNGPIILQPEIWKSVPMTINSFAYMAEVTATLLKRGLTYSEVPVIFSIPEQKGLNIAMLRRNIWGVGVAIGSIFWRIRVKKKLYI